MTMTAPANMVQGRVATLFMDESANRARFTVEGDARCYDTTMQSADMLAMNGVTVRFFHHDGGDGTRIVHDIRFGGIPLPDDATLDAALHESLRSEIAVIAAIRRSPTLGSACGDAGPRLLELSEQAELLLRQLGGVSDAAADPHPSNPAMLPIYRRLRTIGSEFGAIVTSARLFATFIKDGTIMDTLDAERRDGHLSSVIRMHGTHIDGESIAPHRFNASKALEAYEASSHDGTAE